MGQRGEFFFSLRLNAGSRVSRLAWRVRPKRVPSGLGRSQRPVGVYESSKSAIAVSWQPSEGEAISAPNLVGERFGEEREGVRLKPARRPVMRKLTAYLPACHSDMFTAQGFYYTSDGSHFCTTDDMKVWM